MQLSSTKRSIIYRKKKKFQPTKSQKVALSNCPVLSPKWSQSKKKHVDDTFQQNNPQKDQ